MQGEQDDLDTLIRRQNEKFHELREQIKEYLSKDCQKLILKHNVQHVPRDKKEVIEINRTKILEYFVNLLFFFITAPGSYYRHDFFWCDQSVQSERM